MLRRIRATVRDFADAAMFGLAAEGYTSVFEALTGFRGVGPKCANLPLGIACGHSRIGVDIHVHA